MSGYHFETVEHNKNRDQYLAFEFQKHLLTLVKRFARTYGREQGNGLSRPIVLALSCSKIPQAGREGASGKKMGRGVGQVPIHPLRRGPCTPSL